MSGTIALKISIKMNQQLANVKRQLITASDAISIFSGYVDALADVQVITEDEATAFLREFVNLLIG